MNIDVVCGIIIQSKKVLVAQRSIFMKLPLKWEFPGGKMRQGETEEQCLQRELFEELNILVKVKEKFFTNIHQYSDFTICLIAYLAEIEMGTVLLYEHRRVEWFGKFELQNLDWAPADIPIVDKLIQSLYS